MTTTAKTQDLKLERDALAAVADVQDRAEHDGRCPNWMLPVQIPSQRLQGLRRRGYLAYDRGTWWLTENGCKYLDRLRAAELG